MTSILRRFWIVPLAAAVLLTGCATTRARRAEAQDPQAQVADLQNQLIAKDQEIQDLRYQLDSSRPSMPSSNFSAGSRGKSDILRVSGVSALEVQRALLRAGFDPGPLDGRPGKKTKAAVRSFQRKHSLSADGVVGDKTWALLRSY